MTIEEKVKKFWKETEKVMIGDEAYAPKDIPENITVDKIDEIAEKVADVDKEVFKAWLKYEIQGEYPTETKLDVQDSHEVLAEKLRKKIWKTLNGEKEDGYHNFEVVNVFEDSVVVRDYPAEKLYEASYILKDGEIMLGEPKEVKLQYVEKKMTEAGLEFSQKNNCELTGPIIGKSKKQRIAYAAVLVPGELDSDGESVTKEKIETAAHEWMRSYRNVDLQHSLNNVAVPVESYIIPEDRTVKAFDKEIILPAGTWILASKVLDDSTWKSIEKGELTGYSVMGIKRTAFESANKSADMALKKTLLRDLGEDWVAAAVSIVDEPAVPKAKFFALKEKIQVAPEGADPAEKESATEKTWYQKIMRAIMPAEKEGKKISKSSQDKIQTAIEALTALLEDANLKKDDDNTEEAKKEVQDVNKEEMKEIMDEAIKGAIGPLQEEIATMKAAAKQPETGSDESASDDSNDNAADTAGKSEDKNEEVEALKAQLAEAEAKLAKRTAASKSLKGQDGDETEAQKSVIENRDGFGRKKK